MSDSVYDMKKKLIEIQNQLLKNSTDPSSLCEADTVVATAQKTPIKSEDLATILRELYKNQQKMMSMLTEILSKMK